MENQYDAIEAAKMANAHGFVEELKQNYQTGMITKRITSNHG